MVGSPGDDEMHGGPGNDVLHGYDQDDTMYGEGGNDVLSGGHRRGHHATAAPATTSCWRGSEDDQLYGEDGSDSLEGQTGDDLHDGGGDPGDVDYCGPELDTYNADDGFVHQNCERPAPVVAGTGQARSAAGTRLIAHSVPASGLRGRAPATLSGRGAPAP